MAKPTGRLTPPPPPGRPGGLGEKVEQTVERFFAWLFNNVIETIADWFSWGLEQFMHFLRPARLGSLDHSSGGLEIVKVVHPSSKI